jgi:hypothetical protein
VATKPARAGQKEVPEDAPKNGGNMRFPAPKNIEKSIRPINNVSVFFMVISPFFKMITPADWPEKG